MKKVFSILVAVAITVSAFAQRPDSKPVVTKALSDAGIKDVYAETTGGNISIAGVASEARLEVYAEPSNWKANKLSEQEIKDKLQNEYDLKIDVASGKLTVTARPKDRHINWKKALSISFKIYVPKEVSTDLSTSGGNIDLANLTGKLKFTTSGGNLTVNDAGGKIDGTTSGGNITIAHAKDEIELTTSGGNIDASDCSGKVDLTTSGGNLHLKTVNGNIKATTSGGDVTGDHIEGDLVAGTSGGNLRLTDLSCSLNGSTSGGNITVEMIKLGDHLKLSNSGGDISVQLPKNTGADLTITGDKIHTDRLENFSGKVEDDKIEGKINGGGISVVIKSNGGRVNLALK